MLLRKLVLSIGISLLLGSAGLAKTIKAEALTPFSTEKPSQTIKFKVIEDVSFDDITLYKGNTVEADVKDISGPKRLKRNAFFTVTPKTYTDPNGHTKTFKNNYICKYSLPMDKKDMAIKAGATVGGFFIKGLSLGVSAVRGAIENEDDNRFKSAATQVYEDSPISMVENGQEVNLQTGDIFYLKFKTESEIEEEEEHSEPNYTYTEPTKQ